MTDGDFRQWLERYKMAWETRDAQAAAALFTTDAEYFWTPFERPKTGPTEIEAAWREATSRQRDIRFTFEILAVSGRVGMARWHTQLVRTGSGRTSEIDGVLVCEFENAGRCRVFREWWHSTE